MTLASAIYRGRIRHRRFAPKAHAFSYPMFMMYLDLDELDHVFAGRWFWRTNGRGLAEFRRSDFHGDPAIDLRDAVRTTVANGCGSRPEGPIRLLAHLRYFGYSFNPVVFYYCYEADGTTLHSVLAEITNTPWRERHAYVLAIKDGTKHQGAWHWQFDKAFHVSPFLPMDLRYDWRFQAPDDQLRVHMDVRSDTAEPRFDATLVLDRQPLTAATLAFTLCRFPWMTFKVIFAIHWQALLIYLKRNPVFDHPGTQKEAL